MLGVMEKITPLNLRDYGGLNACSRCVIWHLMLGEILAILSEGIRPETSRRIPWAFFSDLSIGNGFGLDPFDPSSLENPGPTPT